VTPEPLPRPIAWVDRQQQRHPLRAAPFAVVKKFGDDDAGSLASLVSHYAFLSVFPLLVVLATLASRLLVGHPELADEIVRTAAGSFLSVGGDGTSFAPLEVSGPALVVGVVVGLPLTRVLQALAVRAVGGPVTSVVATIVVVLLNAGIIATAFRTSHAVLH
jgi:hypothetical protein